MLYHFKYSRFYKVPEWFDEIIGAIPNEEQWTYRVCYVSEVVLMHSVNLWNKGDYRICVDGLWRLLI